LPKIALKVDVDTLRGTREGVPRLLGILDRLGVRATFLFSLGPDHTGWAMRRVFRPGFLSKVSRTSVVAHYGLRTLMYGVLLPAPDIGRRCAEQMRAVGRAGHECGIHTWDHVVWQDNVRARDATWTRRQMKMSFDRYAKIFGESPVTHGAAGWQMNATAFSQIDDWGMAYASDGRGDSPYVPVVDGRVCSHVQLPTTLPTFDEIIGTSGVTEANVDTAVLAMTDEGHDRNSSRTRGRDEVFTLHAELEGGLLAPNFEALLSGWLAQGHQLISLGDLFASIDRQTLPELPVAWGSVPGRSGELITAASTAA
jgi:undecaprenyl phosphate-alpha-L-ara4FN deformylase